MKTTRRSPASPDDAHAVETERRDGTQDRRDDARRRKLEMLLDRFFRPGRWATRTFDAVGLQSGRPVHVDQQRVTAARRGGAQPLRVAFASDFHAGATTAEPLALPLSPPSPAASGPLPAHPAPSPVLATNPHIHAGPMRSAPGAVAK